MPFVAEADARAGVGVHAVSSVEGAGNEARHRFYLFCRQRGAWPLEVGGANPKQDPAVFEAFCPVRLVTPGFPPTLLLHGDVDTDVPYEQSVLMASALEAASVPHTLIMIAGGAHGFDHDLDRPDVGQAFERVQAFLRGHATLR